MRSSLAVPPAIASGGDEITLDQVERITIR
jgi:hypothetical protein